MFHFSGYATALDAAILTAGITLGPPASGPYPGVYASVYLANTSVLAAIYSTGATSQRENPFLVNTDGSYAFDAVSPTYTVVFSTTPAAATTPREVQIPAFASASLPACSAATAGRLAKLTNSDRGLWMDTGAAWVSVSGMRCVDVTAFGAVGDGVTDDAPAIQAAIDALGSQGGVVYFPHTSACYRVNTTLRIGKGVRLIGSGWYDAIIANVAGGPNVVITTVSGGGGGIEIAHLQIICQNVGDIAVKIKGVDHASVHDCYLYSSVSNATLLQLDRDGVGGAYTHRVENNILQFVSGNASQIGISMVGGITASVVAKNHILADNAIVQVAGASSHGGNVFAANLCASLTATPSGTGMTFAGGAAPSSGETIASNYFDSYATGILFGSGCTAMMPLNNHWDNVTTPITDGTANNASGSLIDLETNQIALGSTVGLGRSSFFSQGDSATDAIGFRTFNKHAGGRGWSWLNGSSAAGELGLRDDTAGTYSLRVSATGTQVVGAFAANGATPQTPAASGGALAAYGAGANGFDTGAHASALYAMVVAIRAALVANGIMS